MEQQPQYLTVPSPRVARRQQMPSPTTPTATDLETSSSMSNLSTCSAGGSPTGKTHKFRRSPLMLRRNKPDKSE